MLSADDCIYHFGGLSDTYTEKYHGETGLSERVSSSQAQFRGRGFHINRVRTQKGDKYLIIGGVTARKIQIMEIYELSLKE